MMMHHRFQMMLPPHLAGHTHQVTSALLCASPLKLAVSWAAPFVLLEQWASKEI